MLRLRSLPSPKLQPLPEGCPRELLPFGLLAPEEPLLLGAKLSWVRSFLRNNRWHKAEQSLQCAFHASQACVQMAVKKMGRDFTSIAVFLFAFVVFF